MCTGGRVSRHQLWGQESGLTRLIPSFPSSLLSLRGLSLLLTPLGIHWLSGRGQSCSLHNRLHHDPLQDPLEGPLFPTTPFSCILLYPSLLPLLFLSSFISPHRCWLSCRSLCTIWWGRSSGKDGNYSGGSKSKSIFSLEVLQGLLIVPQQPKVCTEELQGLCSIFDCSYQAVSAWRCEKEWGLPHRWWEFGDT